MVTIPMVPCKSDIMQVCLKCWILRQKRNLILKNLFFPLFQNEQNIIGRGNFSVGQVLSGKKNILINLSPT